MARPDRAAPRPAVRQPRPAGGTGGLKWGDRRNRPGLTRAGNARIAEAKIEDVGTDIQQIHIVTEGLAGHVPTALNLDDAPVIADKPNRRRGLDREAWTAMAAAPMQAEDDDPEGGSWH
ncbi:MAG: hypothetical protein OXC11_02405 [Rhodospirillales bacterium]|nr:hypothetical protein [Rhodospirillales bacterium]